MCTYIVCQAYIYLFEEDAKNPTLSVLDVNRKA